MRTFREEEDQCLIDLVDGLSPAELDSVQPLDVIAFLDEVDESGWSDGR